MARLETGFRFQERKGLPGHRGLFIFVALSSTAGKFGQATKGRFAREGLVRCEPIGFGSSCVPVAYWQAAVLVAPEAAGRPSLPSA